MKIKVVHCKKDEYDIYVGRPSVYGNPFAIGRDGNREEVIEKHDKHLDKHPEIVEQLKKDVEEKGGILGCWCSPMPCHADNYVRRLS